MDSRKTETHKAKSAMISDSAMIDHDARIYDHVEIGENAVIGKGAVIYPGVVIGSNTSIGPYCILGEPKLSYYRDRNEHVFQPTFIGNNSIIRAHTIIYEDVSIGEGFQTGHHVTIREETRIGSNCSVGTLCDIQGRVTIGDHVRLHSNVHISQLTEIEDFVWIYPYTVTTNDSSPPLGNLKGCKIRQFSQIATGSKIMPGVVVGENSLVGAGSVVTRDVEPMTVVFGVPARDKGSVLNIKDDQGDEIYPWKNHLKQDRGYPWQK